MEIEVDTDACVGGGQCVRAAAELFDQSDDDGVVILLNASPEAEYHDAAREAAMICPAAAIRIIE
ncbi:ferredoxin [Rhodococcus sp. NPDC059968]|uniref:ferredoxin n=1 Tax=Rhodococcus sp. NPDC059968 TaxID=3347017 RepID=UPI00366D7BFB